MNNEHFDFDPDENVIRLKQRESASLLLAILTAGKFGQYLDEKLLLNAVASDLIRQLSNAVESVEPTKAPQSRPPHAKDFLFAIGDQILRNGAHIGWWKMTHPQQIEFIQNVVAVPHSFLEEEIEDIFDAIDSGVFHATELVRESRENVQQD